MGQIRLATAADRAAIGELRVQAYHEAADFLVVNPCFIKNLRWGDEDAAAAVVGIWSDSDELVATMRLEVLADAMRLREFASGLSAPADHTEWPALGSSRTAIRKSDRRTGLVMLMRYYFVRSALESGTRRLYSYVISRPAGTSMADDMGYEYLPRSDQDPDLAAERPWELRWLDLQTKGTQALKFLDRLTGPLRRQYPWSGPPLLPRGLRESHPPATPRPS